MIEEQLLIEEVRLQPSLYDIHSVEYRNKNVRRMAWEEIGNNLNMSAEICKTEWNKLRNCFMNAIRRRRVKQIGQVAKYIPPWKYSTQMEFLLPFLDNKEMYTKVESEEPLLEYNEMSASALVETIDDAEGSLGENNFIEATGPSNLDPLESHSILTLKRPKIEPTIDTINVLKDNINYRRERREEIKAFQMNHSQMDDVEMFYMSMAKIAKRLPKIEEARLRQEVCRIVSEAEIKHLENESW